MTVSSRFGVVFFSTALVVSEAAAQSSTDNAVHESESRVDVVSPIVSGMSSTARRQNPDGSSRRGVLLRSNVALVAAKAGGFDVDHPQYAGLVGYRFATVNHISIGYGWRKDFAPTIDGFRLVMPHYPSHGDPAKFEMRVDAETLGLGLGTTSYFARWSLHVGQTFGYVMGRIGGGLLDPPKFKGFGGLAFAGYEFMRSQRIAIVLYGQWMNVIMFDANRTLSIRALGMSLGVTYW
jgi:hypothetical protein